MTDSVAQTSAHSLDKVNYLWRYKDLNYAGLSELSRTEAMHQIQKELLNAGYLTIKVDGILGPITNRAYNNWKELYGSNRDSTPTGEQTLVNYLEKYKDYPRYYLNELSYTSAMFFIQKDLQQQGYDPGKIDGIFGQLTWNAYKAWKESNGSEITPEQKNSTDDYLSGYRNYPYEYLSALSSTSAMFELQRALNDAGYDTGKIDGVVGPITWKAYSDWKSDVDLQEQTYNGSLVLDLPEYIETTDVKNWPPFIKNSTDPYSCVESPNRDGSGFTLDTYIKAKKYCIRTSYSDDTNGVEHEYTYTTPSEVGGTYTTTFTLLFNNCDAFREEEEEEEENYTTCKENQASFTKNRNDLVDSIVQEKF